LVDSSEVRLLLWDTVGQERFRGITPMYYRNAAAAIVVYSIAHPETFDSVDTWISSLREHSPDPLVILVAGNKSDLQAARQIEWDEGAAKADSACAQFFEVSALQNHGIDELFEVIAAKCLELAKSKAPPDMGPPPDQGQELVEDCC
jgi:small GTP-binding protein